MIYPIVAYGDPVLKKKATPIKQDFEGLGELIKDMFETMERAHGVGLAAPQIGKSIRLFIVDASPFAEEGEPEFEVLKDFKRTFINAQIIEEVGEPWAFNEGCLSIPEIREDVFRKPNVTLRYFDENFNEKTESFSGLPARIIQHEYDHIEGILFTDRLSNLRKRLLKGKLGNISKGKIAVDYKMRFPFK